MLSAWDIKMLEEELEKQKQEREVKDNEAITRLAEYEDSGLSPEEVQKLKKSDASKEQCIIDQHGEIHRLRDELKRYKQAEQEGRLVVLPCKTEDTVFIVYAKKILETTVDKRAWTDDDGYMLRTKEEWFKEKDIGKTVFLTREEAEKALEVW